MLRDQLSEGLIGFLAIARGVRFVIGLEPLDPSSLVGGASQAEQDRRWDE